MFGILKQTTMKQFNLFNDTVCEVMTLANGKCLVRDCMGEVNEVYQYELQDIPLSKELLEYLAFRFKEADYKIKGCKCYKLTKVSKMYFTLTDFIEVEEPTPQIGCIVMSDGEVRFSVFTRTSVDGEIGSHWVDNLNKFLYLCECVGYRVKVDIEKLNAFMRNKTMGSDRF